jgi:hypothetical protein
VRLAIDERRRIPVDRRTIITPAARALARAHRIFQDV